MDFNSKNGKAIIFSAPSGAGKTTIVHYLLGKFPNLSFSISATSREQRGSEINGTDYYFLEPEDFKTKIKNEELLEWEEVYPDQFYGTLKQEIERIWANEKCAIFDVDVVGGLNLKKQLGANALAVFVQPPNSIELEKRLRMRGTESDEKINMRLQKADNELAYANKFDKILINKNLDEAFFNAENLVKRFLQK
ncbi:MAG: guanylate kinase [Flavobacteriales bacterium]|jgi:guanylate kinase|tara:strand:- start:185 stop:766 length:582 start_codon:yes stop_codon:yes gene_type:complete